MSTYLWIALGGALGSVARYGCSSLIANLFGQTFPLGTLVINIAGSFVIGLFATLTGPDGRVMLSGDIRQFVTIGLCGGYTTFSSFSYQTLTLAQKRNEFYGARLLREGPRSGRGPRLCLCTSAKPQ